MYTRFAYLDGRFYSNPESIYIVGEDKMKFREVQLPSNRRFGFCLLSYLAL